MFETAELGARVSDDEFREREPSLRRSLLEAQVELAQSSVPLLIVFGGVDGAGKGESANMLNAWMDPRGIRTHAYDAPTQIELEMPEQWRFWRDLPRAGSIGVYLSAWYHRPFMDRVDDRIDAMRYKRDLEHQRMMERMWVDGGARILKFWMHLGHEQQRERFEALEADPRQAWRVSDRDWANWKRYDRFIEAAEELIGRTSSGHAAWQIVEGADENYRTLTVAEQVLAGMRTATSSGSGLKGAEVQGMASEANGVAVASDHTRAAKHPLILSSVDLRASVRKSDYHDRLPELQGRLNEAYRAMRHAGRSAIAIFEGWDAAGKGGAIRRMIPAFDARHVQVHRVAAPTADEQARHYLWRFWRKLPRSGEVAVFDRSWYGRVLVERIEGFARPEEWRRAYAEINDFEHRLLEHGMIVVKLWLHISPDEQEKRFQKRSKVSYKRWKLTDEDWRNRERWGAYELAVHEMVERTSSANAPWTLVPGNDKRHARLSVLETLCRSIEAVVNPSDE